MPVTKILFLVPYPLDEAPSQRFRFEQYFHTLKESAYTFRVQSFLSVADWRRLYTGGGLRKAMGVVAGLLRRVYMLLYVGRYQFVFIHREAAPIGPPIFEWIIANIFRKKIIYDFDDAIWMTDQVNESTLARIIRWRSKVASICRWSYRVSCGNDYLAAYARQFNQHVVVNPTTIDTVHAHHPDRRAVASTKKLVIGWTGSHSTLKYLQEIESVLRQLGEKHPHIEYRVIANRPPALNVPAVTFVPWKKETEIEDLAAFDIGIMPLPDDEWSKGKCGFKALQYMAMGIPTVASPVGVNTHIIQPGVNGYLCTTPDEWMHALELLIHNPALRNALGNKGRETVEHHYSVKSNTPVFLSLFR